MGDSCIFTHRLYRALGALGPRLNKLACQLKRVPFGLDDLAAQRECYLLSLILCRFFLPFDSFCCLLLNESLKLLDLPTDIMLCLLLVKTLEHMLEFS